MFDSETVAEPGATLSFSALPFAEYVVYEDSSFFTQPDAPPALPSPAEVRATGADLASRNRRHPLAFFPSLNLLVKYGHRVTIAEGQCLWAVRRICGGAVPVPEVYGWCRDGDEVFIYMELIHGRTLDERWPALSTEEKVECCKQLRLMIDRLRTLKQAPGEEFIGECTISESFKLQLST